MDIENIFSKAPRFNQDLSKWDVSKITAGKMNGAFYEGFSFNFKTKLDVAWQASNPTVYSGTTAASMYGNSCSWGGDGNPDLTCGICSRPSKADPASVQCNGENAPDGTRTCTFCKADDLECCPIPCADAGGDGVAFEQSQCDSGFTLKTDDLNNVFCAAAQCATSDCCLGNPCTAVNVANSNKASGTADVTGSTNDEVVVTCDEGWSITGTTDRTGTAVCATDGNFNTLTCSANSCATTEVAHSDKKVTASIIGTTGQTVTVNCDEGYAGTPTFTATCGVGGTFNDITCAAESCVSVNVANSNKASGTADVTGSTNDEVVVTCDEGWSITGTTDRTGTAVCATDGNFNTLTCSANSCATTEVAHSDKKVTASIIGTTGQTVTVNCDEGYAGTPTFTATCGVGGTFNDITCAAESCVSVNVAHSDHASGTADITGTTTDTVTVACLQNFHGGGDTVCEPTLEFSPSLVCDPNPTCTNTDGSGAAFLQENCAAGFTVKTDLSGLICASSTCVSNDCCDANDCTATEVAHSNKKAIAAITGTTGETVTVTCKFFHEELIPHTYITPSWAFMFNTQRSLFCDTSFRGGVLYTISFFLSNFFVVVVHLIISCR